MHCDGWQRNRKEAGLWEEMGKCECICAPLIDVGGVYAIYRGTESNGRWIIFICQSVRAHII